MRAVVLTAFGDPELLRLEELPSPSPGIGEVRIDVQAWGTNPVDAQNRADGSWAGLAVPCVLGYDVAGVVASIGPAVDEFRIGDRVMAMMPFPAGGGYAEQVIVGVESVARIAESTSFVEAAATPLAAGTAELVLTRLKVGAGDRLLVLGASGGVGLFLLQLAVARGVRVVAVGRKAMHDQMRGLGAAWCLDYQTEDVASRAVELAGGPLDGLADLVGGRLPGTCLTAVRPHGAIASIATPELDLDLVLDANLTFHGVLLQDDGARVRRLADLLAQGTLRPVISRVLPLAEVEQAHRLLDHGHSGGKIVLTPS